MLWLSCPSPHPSIFSVLSLSYGEALYALLYLFAAAGALGLVSILVGVLSNSKASSPAEMDNHFQLTRARFVLCCCFALS